MSASHPKVVTSAQSPIIKEVVGLLQKSKNRRQSGRCVIEGLREVERAVRSGVIVETILYRPELISLEQVNELFREMQSHSEVKPLLHIHCAQGPFSRIAYRSEVANVVAVATRPALRDLPSLRLFSPASPTVAVTPPFLLLLEGIEKPGNLGAILRTADAMGVSGVILIDCPAELDHPNTIRNSLGAAFSLEVAVMDADRARSLLYDHEIPLYVTYLNDEAMPLSHARLDQPCALLLGAEATGVHESWLTSPESQSIIIPMAADRVVDSLNVSVAAAMTMYEVKRQRSERV